MKIRFILAALAALGWTSVLCAEETVPQTVVNRAGQELKLVWNDEFNGEGLPDPNTWGYEVGYVRNREEQYYTDARVENVFQKDGLLTIRTLKEKYPIEGKPKNLDRTEADYTSAAIETKNKVFWTYGRFEIRAKLPKGKGIWPAIWMLSEIDPWPNGGEIDIMEYVGFMPGYAHGTIHSSRNDDVPNSYYSKGNKILLDAPEEKFHDYILEWDSEQLTIMVDDQVVLEYPRSEEESKMKFWPYDKPHYLILNTAIGGSWGGEIAEDTCPTDFQIDYVRVYQ